MLKCLGGFMRRTTIILQDEIYREIVSEAVTEYGSTRKLSAVVNQLLGEKLSEKKQQRRPSLQEIFGSAKGIKQTAQEFKEEMRDAWG